MPYPPAPSRAATAAGSPRSPRPRRPRAASPPSASRKSISNDTFELAVLGAVARPPIDAVVVRFLEHERNDRQLELIRLACRITAGFQRCLDFASEVLTRNVRQDRSTAWPERSRMSLTTSATLARSRRSTTRSCSACSADCSPGRLHDARRSARREYRRQRNVCCFRSCCPAALWRSMPWWPA